MVDDVREFLQRAVDEAARSPAGGARVGAVLVTKNGQVYTGHKNESAPPHLHAEVVVLNKAAAAGAKLRGGIAFVTLEPCANIEANRTPCAQLLADAGVTTVYIGRYDRMPRVRRQGWRLLTDHGVLCRDFPADLRDQLDQLNATQNGWFIRREGLSRRARFDHMQNGGRYDLATGDGPEAATWVTEWTPAGKDSIYAYGGRPGFVASAPFAREFEQVDDPDAYDYGSSSVMLAIGDIAIYRNERGHALVRLRSVEAGPSWGTSHTELVIDYELRPTTAPTNGAVL